MKFILSESQLKKIISHLKNDNSVLNEEKIVLGKGGDVWDYKKDGNNYFARKKNNPNGPWIKVKGSPAVSIAKKIFGVEISPSVEDNSEKKLYQSFFKNSQQGNKFRGWVNKWYPNIAKKYDLDLKGPYDNNTIKKVASEVVNVKKTMQNRILNPTGKANLGTLFFQQNVDAYSLSSEKGKTLPSLVKTGFKINKQRWSPEEGYYVDKCTQEGCAQYTYDMIGDKFGDAWQAYQSFDSYASVSPSTVNKMEKIFNSINKRGFPQLNAETDEDNVAKNLLISLVPDQNEFKNLKLGDVVGLYYPDSSNYDLAFFQSAIGKSRDQNGNWIGLRPPYFCSDPTKCSETKWTTKDIKSDKTFKANPSLANGKSFMPNTHLGFIGYIDENGEPYVIHNVHKTVYAYPVSKMKPGKTLSIVWAGSPN